MKNLVWLKKEIASLNTENDHNADRFFAAISSSHFDLTHSIVVQEPPKNINLHCLTFSVINICHVIYRILSDLNTEIPFQTKILKIESQTFKL